VTVIAPMEALLVEQLPDEPGWQFEPKWDGFRCIAIRDGERVEMWSKSGKPLGRYFPEVLTILASLSSKDVILDGELVIERPEGLSFDALQMRLHPAESRIRKLAAETPAQLMLFDLLRLGGEDLTGLPLAERRKRLAHFISKQDLPGLILSPATTDRSQAAAWLERSGGALDGVIGKRLEDSYRSGERALVKVKQHRTADCVIGGFRYDKAGANMASLLLGLYDDEGLLDHVGFCSSFSAADKREWTPELEALIEPPGFTGNKPGGPSRWNQGRETEWKPLRPAIVVEVLYDQVTSGRFRHGTRFLRRRPDKAPEQCRMDQLRHPLTPAELEQLLEQ
jgi:ATP-dependent DNA ligase